jgi:hypothetical protein
VGRDNQDRQKAMKIDNQWFDPTALGTSYALDFVRYRYHQLRNRGNAVALEFAAIKLRQLANGMDRIRAKSRPGLRNPDVTDGSFKPPAMQGPLR